MSIKKYIYACLLLMSYSFLTACNKQTEKLDIYNVTDLYPIALGKTYLYRLDSTITANFGSQLVTNSYLAKDSVESTFLDASGRANFRIFRYLTDTLQKQPWRYTATYIAVVNKNTIEWNDQNLRFISLAEPVSYNTLWKGNAYISAVNTPYYFLTNWQYQYQDIDSPFKVLSGTMANTVTVIQADDQSSANFDPNNVFFKTYSKEVYAKGVGLIYKEFLHINYQVIIQNGNIINRYYVNDNTDITYGLKLNLISYR